MSIDFKAEVDKRREAMMADLFSLLAINSERDDSLADKEHPFGPGPVLALEKFLEMAERDGYETRMSIIMPGILPLVRERKNWASLPTWTWCQQEADGRPILMSLKSSMASSMLVELRMTRDRPWPAITA